MSKGKPLIGTVRVPYQHVEVLRARAAEIKNAALPHPGSMNLPSNAAGKR
jgi:hypothetical protein